MVWLTPAMDGLFMGAASERRRFFDRLVLAIDSEHSSRVSALERSLRSRSIAASRVTVWPRVAATATASSAVSRSIASHQWSS